MFVNIAMLMTALVAAQPIRCAMPLPDSNPGPVFSDSEGRASRHRASTSNTPDEILVPAAPRSRTKMAQGPSDHYRGPNTRDMRDMMQRMEQWERFRAQERAERRYEIDRPIPEQRSTLPPHPAGPINPDNQGGTQKDPE